MIFFKLDQTSWDRGGHRLRSNRSRKRDASSINCASKEVCVVDLNSCKQNDSSVECERSSDHETGGIDAFGLSETLRSRYTEETRCSLCDGIVNKAGCLTCPKGALQDLPADEFGMCNDELNEGTEERTIKETKLTDDCKKTKGKKTCCKPSGVASFTSQDSDSIVSPPKSKITQSDLFCDVCLYAFTRDGCLCDKKPGELSTDKFYSRSKNVHSFRYSGRKYGSKCYGIC